MCFVYLWIFAPHSCKLQMHKTTTDWISERVFHLIFIASTSRCLKIIEKVSFNTASEASYLYILSGQKLIKMPKMINFASFLKLKAGSQTVLPDTLILKKYKNWWKMPKLKTFNETFYVIFKHCEHQKSAKTSYIVGRIVCEIWS